MPKTYHDLLDIAIGWVDARQGAYLAKENTIVYYSSLTGRASDYKWRSLTMSESCRIINATLLASNDAERVTENVLLTACQELGRVYEFGVKSHHKVGENIFNLLEEAKTSLPEEVMDTLAKECFRLNKFAMLHADVVHVFESVLTRLHYDDTCSPQERNQLLEKYFIGLGYVVKTTSQRVLFKGKKVAAIMTMNVKPSDISEFSIEETTWLVSRIVGSLK